MFETTSAVIEAGVDAVGEELYLARRGPLFARDWAGWAADLRVAITWITAVVFGAALLLAALLLDLGALPRRLLG
jgi:hypothetical protein